MKSFESFQLPISRFPFPISHFLILISCFPLYVRRFETKSNIWQLFYISFNVKSAGLEADHKDWEVVLLKQEK